MNCTEVVELLDRLAADELTAAEAVLVDTHLEHCAACRQQAEAARALFVETAKLPRSLAPTRDLWPEIRNRIEDRKVVGLPRRLRRMSWSQVMGLAAVLVIGIALVIGYSMQQPRDETRLVDHDPGASPEAGAAGTVLAGLDHGDAGFQSVREELLRVIALKSSSLSPESRVMIMDSLITIDKSINDIKVALGESPGDPRLTRLLVSTRRQEINLLKRAAELSQDI